MYKNPENFDFIEVRGESIPMGEIAPFNVLGFNSGWLDREEVVIAGPFANKQVAETWLRVYLETYVKDRYAIQAFEGPLFDKLDS